MSLANNYYRFSTEYEKKMESLNLISNLHSSIRNGLITISISYLIFTALSNKTFTKNISHEISIFIAFCFIFIGVIICLFTIKNILDDREKHPEILKWIIPHIIMLFVFLLIIYHKVMNDTI